jgi:hypothetical protein
LKQWAAKQSADPLAQLCAYCSDWLSRDVLPGYRDLEADADLEAYFADRDVQAYVEGQEPLSGPASASPQPSVFGAASDFLSGFTNPFASDSAQGPSGSPSADLPAGVSTAADPDEQLEGGDLDDPQEPWLDAWLPQWHWPENLRWPTEWQLRWPTLPAIQLPSKRQLGFGGAGVVVVALAATALVRSRSHGPKPQPPQSPLALQPVPATKPVPKAAPAAPLGAPEPSDAQIQALLEAWLNAKAALLAGKTSTIPLAAMARPSQIERLEATVAADQNRGETEAITTKIQSFVVDERSPSRIAATVGLDYGETRLDRSGSAIGPATSLQLRNRYVFARDNGNWRLVSFRRAAG